MLKFNVETRTNKQYALSEEDSQKVIERAKKIADQRTFESSYPIYLDEAVRQLLNEGKIEGELFSYDEDDNITSVWEK